MAELIISANNSSGAIPINQLEFSLRTSLQATHLWVASNVFSNLAQGTYYGTVRRRSDSRIIGTSVLTVLSSTNLPFEREYLGGEIWITQAEHGKSKISSVMIIDKATGWSLNNNFRLITNNLPPYDEGVAITVEAEQKVVVRIY